MSDRDDGPRSPRHPEARRQPEELPRGLIIRILLSVVAVGAALCFVTYVVLRMRLLQLRPSGRFPEQSLPAPHEVSNVRQEMFRIPNPWPTAKDQQRADLATFGWVDRQRRIVHIPIEAAIEMTARGDARKGKRP